MDGSTASWVALVAITGLLVGGSLLQKTERASPLESLGSVILLLGTGCSVVIVFQGFHLWNLGWEGIPIEPETAGKMASRTGGKGGILLLVIQFLPQFLVFGYGALIWEGRHQIRYAAKVLGLKS
jgi:hypothetical protein